MDVDSAKLSSSSGTAKTSRGRKGRRKKTICLSVIAVILVLAIILLVLGLTVFKAKRPVIAVDSVSLRDFSLSLDIARLRVFLNITVDANLRITNRNKVGFEYTNSTALLKYRGEVVGEVPVPAGEIGAGQTLPMSISLTLMADRLLSNSNLYSDVISGGTLHISTFTKVSGYVRILFKIHVVSYSTCDLYVDVRSGNLSNQTCQYKTKL